MISGCSQIGELVSGSGSVPATPLAVPAGQEPLARFYEQALDWVDCGPGECAELVVPLDYADPDGESIEISVLKVPASGRNRIGSLVVNPGGPGGSGVDYAAAADFIVGPEVRRRYDIVGFDPRGVSRSAPVSCFSDAELDEFLGTDPTPDDAREKAALAEQAQGFAQACEANVEAVLPHMSTVDAAKDLDILRSTLREEQLTYLGKSYGTYLGAVYAEQFPERVGRFVLDGALPPDLTPMEIALGQAQGFERATEAWAADCVEGGCPLGDTVGEVVTALDALLERFDSEPLPVRGDARLEVMTEGWASYGVIAALYDEGMWSFLTDALTEVVEDGEATGLMGLANQYAQRTSSGAYTGNLLQAFYAVSCLDRPAPTAQEYAAGADEAARVAPTWGRFLVGTESVCGYWPHAPVGEGARTIEAPGAAPIVVIGTSRDPATPLEWSKRLADQLENGVLVSFEGDGHTAYTRSNTCVDDAVDAFFVAGTVPEDGLRC